MSCPMGDLFLLCSPGGYINRREMSPLPVVWAEHCRKAIARRTATAGGFVHPQIVRPACTFSSYSINSSTSYSICVVLKMISNTWYRRVCASTFLLLLVVRLVTPWSEYIPRYSLEFRFRWHFLWLTLTRHISRVANGIAITGCLRRIKLSWARFRCSLFPI